MKQLLRSFAERRRRNAETVLRALGPLAAASILDLSPDSSVVKLVVVLPPSPNEPTAAEMADRLARAGIERQPGYTPCHHYWDEGSAHVPNTERVWKYVLCIPLETPLSDPEALLRRIERWTDWQGTAPPRPLDRAHAVVAGGRGNG